MPEPTPKPGEIKIKVHACGTDLHILKDEFEIDPPVVMGHEYSGIVVALGEGVSEFSIGDKAVSMTTVYSCGHCRYCHEGLFMLCETRKAIGCIVDGGFAEYIVVPASKAFRVSDSISLAEAALSEPLACVIRSIIERGSIQAGDYVYVSGPGTIGLLAMQVATACGGIAVIAGTKVDKDRMDIARKLDAAGTILVDAERCRSLIGRKASQWLPIKKGARYS